MALTTLDFAIIISYLAFVTLFGAWLGKKQTTATDYFLGGRDLPWLAVCFSVIATETSTLTFISIPGLAYLTNMNFLQMTLGYLLGRTIIAFVLLPGYYRGEIKTAYELIGKRFGKRLQSYTAVVFQLTRLLADGVRLFATAIPLAVITGWNYSLSIVVMALLTLIYTFIGGIRAVVWIDVIQLFIYIGGAIVALLTAVAKLPAGWDSIFAMAEATGKAQIFNWGWENDIRAFFASNYTVWSGLIGGAFLSMASHGTDHLMVQRLLTCRDLNSSRKALIGSGIFIIFQFALFLVLGLALYVYFGGASMRSDEVMPRFVVQGLPPGVSGLIIAGIFAAAMSTLSGSLNSVASSTLYDLYKPRLRKALTPARELYLSKMFTLIWGLIFVGGAMLFKDEKNPVVELGLAIASFTYGGLLGAFFLGTFFRHVREEDALVGMWSSIFFMTWIIGIHGLQAIIMVALNLIAAIWIWQQVKHRSHHATLIIAACLMTWLIFFLPAMRFSWPWYVLIGFLVCGIVGLVLSRLHKSVERVKRVPPKKRNR
jgi:solute:Na+ symporter, SSS family